MKLNEYIEKKGISVFKSLGQYLFHQGDQNTSIYILKKGLLKAYYLSAEGKENIKSFIFPGNSIGSLMACHAGQSCSFNVVCMQECELLMVSFGDLYEASKTDIELSSEIIDLLLNFAMKKEIREYEFLCLSAEERYKKLRKTNPEIFDVVTQNEIARYLGVTPVGLSRIKKRNE